MKLGSLFDGSGGFPLAAKNVGMTPVWASEIEPFCVAVTRYNLPELRHYGDVSKINGAEIDPVDVITFGSPCQDMSIAGKKEGLHGSRSGLFFEAIRIIKEMREATNGEFPRFAVWENVLGSLFSNGGDDFGCVINGLLEIVRVDPVVRPAGKWRHASAVCGDEFSLAWRVLDARYFGVPQRRKRVFAVCDFRGQSAPEILFKAYDMSVLPAESGEEGVENAPDSETSADAASERIVFSIEGNSKRPGHHGSGITENGVCYTLNTVERHAVAVFENHGNAGRYRKIDGACQTLTEQLGTGGNNAPLVITTNTTDRWVKSEINVAATLTRKGGTHAPYVLALSACSKDCSVSEDVAPTMIKEYSYPTIIGGENEHNNLFVRFLMPCECAKLQGFPQDWANIKAMDESEFPFWRKIWDDFSSATNVKRKSDAQIKKWMRSPYRESNEYMMWGNGVALPCVQYILGNVASLCESEDKPR